ncbi:hypothetical protein ColKHC_07422 [Colletotrichum higginsianum]|nr:hypothetical protein ColKHC_07422 [Colletotrichum higginsianum]
MSSCSVGTRDLDAADNVAGVLASHAASQTAAALLLADGDEDTGVGRGVEGSTLGTGGELRAGAGNLDVEALGVVLGAVLLAGGVESNDLVAPDVLAGLQGGGDGDLPGEVLGDELVGSPAAAGETSLLDLEELERGLVDGGAVVTARGEVVDDGALVGLGPGVPEDLELVTGGNLGGQGSVLGVAVADDVGTSVGRGGDETVVGGAVGPAVDIGGRVLVGQLGDVVALELLGAVVEVVDVAVGHDGGGASKGGKDNGVLEGRHFCG